MAGVWSADVAVLTGGGGVGGAAAGVPTTDLLWVVGVTEAAVDLGLALEDAAFGGLTLLLAPGDVVVVLMPCFFRSAFRAVFSNRSL